MKHYLLFFCVSFSMVLIFGSCNNDETKGDPVEKQSSISNDSLKIHPLDSTKIMALSDTISPEIDTSNNKSLFSGKGKLWKLWDKLHKNCQNNEMTKGMTYLGVSNTLGVGSIIKYEKSKDGYIASYPMLRDKFNSEEQQVMFKDGTSSSCTFGQKTKLSTDFLIKSKLISTGNASLNTAIENARSIDSKIDSWQQNVLFVDGFNNVINRLANDYSKDYLAASKLPDRYIIVTELEVNGFSAIINTQTTIGADLKLELEKGISDKIGETNATVKFSYAGEKSIKITTIGSFVVFGALYQNE